MMIFGHQEILRILTVAAARAPQAFKFAIALLTGLLLLGLLIVLRRAVTSIASTARYLWVATPSYDSLEPKERIAFITVAVQALGGIAFLVGIYFAWANLRTTQEAQKDTQKNQSETLKNQTKTLQITNEGQITERFTKAIDQLGATDTQGPTPEIRLGGIYALESIARVSKEYHWPIMEVLTTYVRMHASVQKTQDKQLSSNSEKPGTNNAMRPATVPIDAPRPDIQAILTVIGRRERSFEQGKDEILDLSNTNLVKAYLSNATLSNAYLSGAYLYDADLSGANLSNANLNDTHLSGADLSGAHLNGADLSDAHLTAIPSLGVADLSDAHLTAIPSLGVSDAVGLTQEQLNLAKGDKDTELPPGLVMPKSWK